MSNVPKISIITVCYQSVDTIEQAILSVINQTYSNIEYIVIDGASTDGTVDIIKRFQDKITYWISAVDAGIYDAMNKGIDKASGDYIYFIGADDCLAHANIIKIVGQYLHANPVDILCGRVYVVDDVLSTRMQRLNGRPLTNEEIFSGLIAPHQGVFTRMELMKRYRFNDHYKIAADYDFFLRANRDGYSVQYIDDAVAFYSNGGLSSFQNRERINEYIEIIRNNLSNDYVLKYRQKDRFCENLHMKIDRIIRRALSFLGLIQYYRLYYGWGPHKCDNKQCRWCAK